MPITVEVDPRGFVVMRGDGEMCVEDLAAANEQIYTGEYGAAAVYQLVDLSEATRVEASSRGVRRLADQDRDGSHAVGGVAIAIVAPTSFEYGMSRMWQVFAESPGIESEVFRKRDDAVAWLEERIAAGRS